MTELLSIAAIAAAVLLVLAIVIGGLPERILAGALLAIWAFDRVDGALARSLPIRVDDALLLAIDLLAFVVIGGVALRANRIYPLWIGGLQLVKLISHFWRFNLTQPAQTAHAAIEYACLTCQVVVLAVGLVFHLRRCRSKDVNYADWVK